MQELIVKPWNYTFYQDQSSFILEVLCGGTAMFEVKFELSADEVSQYNSKGEKFIDELAESVKLSPDSFMKRKIG